VKILEETDVGEIVIHVYVESVFGMGKSFSKVGDGRGSDAHVGKLSHTNDRVEGGVEEKRIGVASLTKAKILYPSGVGLHFILTVCLLCPENRTIISSTETLVEGRKRRVKSCCSLEERGCNLVCQST